MKRPPVVVVVGHVDHGKTTLLDTIRKANVAAKEAGGITQSVGAYEVIHPSTSSGTNERITFIDTPGHEAFSKMRKRGANIADVAILVVAADDGVQNQTREAIKILKDSETPFVVAINKIDKVRELDKVKNELTQEQVLLEGYGGNVSWQGIAAKTGEGVNELLDLILLTADLEELTYEENAPAEGFILEARMDSRKGITATAILKNGTLRVGDYIQAGSATGKIRMLGNFLSKQVKELLPSSPAVVIGFETLPKIGDAFKTSAAPISESSAAKEKAVVRKTVDENTTSLNLILKADVSGSLEALSGIIKTLPHAPNVHLEVIEESVGDITDGDVKSAVSHHAAVIAFKSEPTKQAEVMARAQNVTIIKSDIIYHLVKAVEDMIKAGTVKLAAGELEVLAIFGKKGGSQIIGGKILSGEIKNAAGLEIHRAGKQIGSGRIINLQSAKRDVPRVEAGAECGMLFEPDTEVKVGDHLIMR